MEAVEAIAVVILVIAVLTLIYYYLQNSPGAMKKIRSYVPDNADAHMNDFIGDNGISGSTGEDLANDPSNDEEKDGIGKKIKVKLGDIDMSGFDTDVFSKKIDAFLNEKSDQLIKEWSLVTTDQLDALEDKFSKTTQSVDDLENQFNQLKRNSSKFQKETKSKLNDLDKRIEALEK